MKPLFVTSPHLPPLGKLMPYLEQIWDSRQLTNNGPIHQQLESRLENFLGVPKLALFSNGTIALLTALKALQVQGEVITTPYSFVATSHAIRWNNCTPVFVDIDPGTGNIDPEKIEAAITSKTTAILGVHVYGNPCKTTQIKQIADNYNLKVIYDSCHAFGIQDVKGSILRHGDLSVLSFHATKVFNTIEGGAIVCGDDRTKKLINHLKNFGFEDETNVTSIGINGKMNELQAAIGLLQLESIDSQLEQRRRIATRYRQALSDVRGLQLMAEPNIPFYNNAYMPVLITDGAACSRDELYNRLKQYAIFARRYFYPLITEFPMYRQYASSDPAQLPNAIKLSRQVLCIPMSSELTSEQQERVITAIYEILNM